MGTKPYHVAVIDFGKTNKKVLIYDRNLEQKASAKKTFSEVRREGFRCDDIDGAMEFVARELKKLAKRFDIRAISVTAHGATVATLAADGKLAFPNVSYDCEPGDEVREAFYARFGDRKALQAETCTPPFPGILNPGLGLFWLQKEFPERFAKVATVQFLPQYVGYLLTGRTAIEPTYCGCHTYLWDFEKNTFGRVAREMGLADKFPADLMSPWDVQGRLTPRWAKVTGLPPDCPVTCGIHDSNSSLLPYLVKGFDRFVLNSTGTWCVSMSPEGKYPLSAEELGKEVFFNLSAFGKPVKTTIFRGGAEFDFYSEHLCRKAKHPAEADPKAIERVVREGLMVTPVLHRGTGVFPRSTPTLVGADTLLADPNLACHALDLSLAIQSKRALTMACGTDRPTVVTEGGFRNNVPYARLLAALMPKAKIFLSNLQEATAYGAAMLGVCAVENAKPQDLADRVKIELVPVEPCPVAGLDRYETSFLSACG